MLAFIMSNFELQASKDLEISKDFTLFTSKNLQGYTKPLFTSIEESFNSHIFTKAQYADHWSIALDISVNGMIIPDAHKTYDAELPVGYGDEAYTVDNASLKGGNLIRQIGGTFKQPTLYGGTSYGIFSAPQQPTRETYNYEGSSFPDSTFKSVAFAEGNNMSFMSGVPAFQLVAGFPSRTQLRLRFWGAPVQDEFMSYFGILVNQQVDHFFDLFGDDSTLGLAMNFAYHNMSRDRGLSIDSWSIGAHISKTWDNGFTVYGGMQYEDMTGTFEAIRTEYNEDDVVDSPYPEVRIGPPFAPLKFDIETFNNFRITGGLSYMAGPVEIHADAAYAQQPVLAFGVTFWIASWGEKVRKQEKIEKFEEIEKIERVNKETKSE